MAQKIVAPQYGIGRAMQHHPQRDARTLSINYARARAEQHGRYIMGDACPALAALCRRKVQP